MHSDYISSFPCCRDQYLTISELRVGEFALVDVWRVQSWQARKARPQEQPPHAVVGKHNCVHLEGEKGTGE